MFLSSTDQSPSNNPSSSSSTFSIRDYAFSYRTKNFEKSWPFSSTSMQLCLKHGLSDPLPPIQTLGCVINHPTEALSLKKPNMTHVETISYKKKSEKLDSNPTLVKTKEDFDTGSKSRMQVGITNKIPRKKINGSKEDQSCLFAASESMALRTCPICKTFSSASNTTLNAHIDQCLFTDSIQEPISKPNKPRVKPKLKVKSMIDIYAVAKRCTIEDLDKRNGTKWAMVSSYSNRVVSDNKPEFKKGKKRNVLSICDDEDASGIGPVYIDNKGQKLRNLSEFNKKTSDSFRELKDGSEKKSFNKGEGNGMERSETPGQGQRRIYNQRMLTKRRLSRNVQQKGAKNCVLQDQPSHENGDSLSRTPLVLRGSSHVSTDLSETVSTSLKSHGEREVSRRKSTEGEPLVAKGVLKLKKSGFDFSDDDYDDLGTWKWESEMTQEPEGTDKVMLSSNLSISGESYEGTGNDKEDADAEFESMFYEKSGCETAEQGSSFMEVDPIPIPGPPGSFLLSPWDIETHAIETHGNSSVITSQIQSSQDHVHLTDRNSSESPVSAMSKFAAPERSRFGDSDQSCCCQTKEKAVQPPPPHLSQQDLDFQIKPVPAAPSSSNLVLRLMGKDLMVINQREEASHEESSIRSISQLLDLSKTQQVSPSTTFHENSDQEVYLSPRFYSPR